MPLYEFMCPTCGAREEVFTRSIAEGVTPPACPGGHGQAGHEMRRVVSAFARHMTMADQIAEAEAKFGKQVDAAMGKEPDVGRLARRYDELAKGLPAARDS